MKKFHSGAVTGHMENIIKNRKALIVILSVLVVVFAVYTLILPATAINWEAAGKEAGMHVEQNAQEQDNETDVNEESPGTDVEKTDADKDSGEETAGIKTGKLVYSGDGYTLSANCDKDAKLPEDTELSAKEIKKNAGDYSSLYEKTLKAIQKEEDGNSTLGLKSVHFYDISLLSDGENVEPSSTVDLKISYDKPIGLKDKKDLRIVHFAADENGNVKPVVLDGTVKDDSVQFETGSFSVFAVAETTIVKTVLTSDGHNYKISVTYGSDTGIPADADLAVEKISGDSGLYDDYVARAENALGIKEGASEYIKLFDIKIVDKDDPDIKYQPAKGTTVDVRIELADAGKTEYSVVHFADRNADGDVIKSTTEDIDNGKAVKFEAEGFSAYAIVEGPSEGDLGWHKIQSIDELISKGSEGLYIGHIDGYFFTDGITNISATRTGITKTKPAAATPGARAVKYYFDLVDGTENKFKVYCGEGNNKKYIIQSTNSLNFTTEDQATVFTIESFNGIAETFRALGNNGYYWNMQSGAGGASFAAYTGANDNNAKMCFMYYSEVEEDPYDLDGKSYGLMFWDNSLYGKGMLSSSDTPYTLDAKPLMVLSAEGDKKHLFVPNDSDISMWTFHWVHDDYYYLTAEINGSTKYLNITSEGLTMVNEASADLIQVVPGTGAHKGEICLKSGGKTLTYSGKAETGFNVGGSVGSEWLNLVELSELTTDYYKTYAANKVSVSDESITTGSKVIVYTRAWNEDTLKYEYYAIDHDGKLVRCYESGNTIEWTGSVINTMLWQFTEYTNADGTPNFYYELYNEYAGKYLAPQVTDGQIVSDDTIGINMNGRRNGRYYSDIIAWDDENYSFAGLKVENGQIVSCPKNEAMDFYFAVMDDIPVDDTLETVKTVDHTQYGITMKIKDFDTRDEMSDFLGNDDGGIGTVLHQGLLSSNLGDDGYPTAKLGSLGNLFAQSQEVNHLFVQSTYNATGYYTYDSSQNFASLKGQTGGDFTVYKELASYDSVGTRNTLKHGQFFPFNDIEAGTFASINGKNLYSTTAQLLPDSDPRKYENLYLIKNVDCYFGVELEASFTQTPDGLDDWGHDIIFEFTGDDDFWLYVDNELVIDLGGIHSAVPGSVNFRTGQVNVNGEWTTLRALFEKNYRSRNPRASDEEVERYLAQYFDEGSTIFRDYTTHTMRIFYMERGAGASNLYMHFNLASVKPGTVELTKELAGVDDSESVLAEFAYQIKYKKKDGTEEYLKNAVSDSSDTKDYVFYKDSEVPVTYKPSKTIGGVNYNDVFILKPDETAVINFPTFGLDEEEIDSYEIIECGVNDEVYSSVKANGAVLPGEAVPGAQGRKDYSIDYNSTKDRPRVVYENTVDPEALRDLTFTKKLFDADGVTPIHDDDTIFNFRLYLSTESDPELAPASEHTYHVKDPEGYYCRWDKSSQSFVSLGKRDYSELTKQEKAAASFDTGPYGTISKIPVDYTVEVRQILAGTRFKVQERPGEIPDGYSFQKYIYNGEESGSSAAEGVTDTIVTGTDPHVDICNLKGYGLRMNKEWTDKDYMSDRDTTYFAVYIQDGDDLTIVPGTLMELPYGTDTLYWYWLTLPVSGTAFEDYVAEEVRITSGTPVFDDEGKITNESSLTIVPISEGGELKLNGTQKGESGKAEFTYTASYERGAVSSNTNVRVDTVTNDRPGILLKKQQWNGEPLAGADFTLTDDAGTEIGEFTSDEDGIISTAFLGEGKDYTLTETGTPQGWHSMEVPMTISKESTDEGVVVNVSGPDSQYYSVTQAHGTDPAIVTIKNRPYTFEAVKKDGDTGKLLKNVHFELHKQVTVGGIISFDLTPLTGYTDLVTDENGVIPKIDETLPPGTYQLREKATPAGYKTLPHYIEFTVTKTGAVTLYRPYSEDFVTLDAALESGGTIDYELDIFNYIDAEVTLYKVDENGDPLKGSKFQLCKYKTSWEVVPEYSSIDMTAVTQKTLTGLSAGRYRLEEMQAPDGYVVMTKYIYFNIDQGGHATLTDEAGTGNNSNENASINNANGITVQNTPGVELPDSGGPGTTWIYMIGGFLTAACGVAIAARRRSKGAL